MELKEILILVLLLGFLVVEIYVFEEQLFSNTNSQKTINIPSQCYTDLQPSKYFSQRSYPPGRDIFPVKVEDDKIIIENFREDELHTATILDSGSMRSGIPDFAMVLIAKVERKDVKVGDIISIKREGGINFIHRVIEITEEGKYITKGDNNVNRDFPEWTFEQIDGKVVGVLW